MFSGDVPEKNKERYASLKELKRGIVVSISVVPVVSPRWSDYHRSLDRIVSEFTRRCELVSRRRPLFHAPHLPQNVNDARLRKILHRAEQHKLPPSVSQQTRYFDPLDRGPAPICGSLADDAR